ncbi:MULTISPECIES: hypothetical protein [unclassified Flavobacterium]|uniref:hypothetical protein n=1 Tax=unclassified Flavobacterium TaxID=196869 RepID=UPI0036213E97
MKTIITTLAIVFALTIQAQNKNVQTEVKTTITTIKDSEGEKKLIKSEVTKEEQKVGVEVEKERPGTKNIPMANNPVEVTKATAINADGKTKVVDVERSTYLMNNGKRYELQSDEGGYTMKQSEGKFNAVLRKTSNNNYIYYNKNKYALGYFDVEGNFILETYNTKSDKITVEKYTIAK